MTPDQYEIDICREVLEALIASMNEHEPHATNTIQDLEDALGVIPNEEDWPNGDSE